MKGNASAIVRFNGRKFHTFSLSGDREATARAMAHENHFGDDPFVIEAFQEWLSGINNPHNIDIWNLLYWEQKLGSWQGMSQLEWDIAQDVLNPVNCRELLAQMLAVKEQHRGFPQYNLLKGMINELWPELLSEPINPHEFKPLTLHSIVKRGVKKIKKVWNTTFQKAFTPKVVVLDENSAVL
jgi:hypothetical protein